MGMTQYHPVKGRRKGHTKFRYQILELFQYKTYSFPPKQRKSSIFSDAALVGEGGFARLRSGRVAALTCPRHVIHFRSLRTTKSIPNKKDILTDVLFVWWGKVDSNHRRHCQQIYSLSPLATREFPHIQLRWSWWTDSNPRPADYKSAALPTELHQHLNRHRSFVLRGS